MPRVFISSDNYSDKLLPRHMCFSGRTSLRKQFYISSPPSHLHPVIYHEMPFGKFNCSDNDDRLRYGTFTIFFLLLVRCCAARPTRARDHEKKARSVSHKSSVESIILVGPKKEIFGVLAPR
jgi:hypothetical protein